MHGKGSVECRISEAVFLVLMYDTGSACLTDRQSHTHLTRYCAPCCVHDASSFKGRRTGNGERLTSILFIF